MTHIRILEPAGRPDRESLDRNIDWLRREGLHISYEPTPTSDEWPLNAGSVEDRAARLNAALTDDSVDLLLAARGGYGVTDLLPLMDWPALARATPKPVVGFSDVCAIQSALFTQLKWAGLHAPMPGSTLFGQHRHDDVDALIECLKNPPPWHGKLPVCCFNQPTSVDIDIRGWLYGGCLAVISNLIGTPYIPASLKGGILFIEDVGEAPGRIARYIAQWQHAGLLDGVEAIVLGAFTNIPGETDEGESLAAVIHTEVERRVPCPVFTTDAFGHVSPNFPIALGATAIIKNNTLTWDLPSFRVR